MQQSVWGNVLHDLLFCTLFIISKVRSENEIYKRSRYFTTGVIGRNSTICQWKIIICTVPSWEIFLGRKKWIKEIRALYKDTPFIILDEPTAALDPIAEAEVYSNMNQIIGNKSAIFISHRLSSCRFCDNILVFHEGKLVQYGNHDILLNDTSGMYYQLWNAQAQYYKKLWL